MTFGVIACLLLSGFILGWVARGIDVRSIEASRDSWKRMAQDPGLSIAAVACGEANELDRCLRAVIKRAPRPKERPHWLRHALDEMAPEGTAMRRAAEPGERA